jgi:hypothetical protein
MSNDENSNKTKNTVSASRGDEGAKPLAPLWIFKIANPIVSALLRSPLHGLMSKMLMLIRYKGHKSGKVFTHPIGYFEWDKDKLMAFTSAHWWVNLRDGKPVTLLIRGQQHQAIPTPIHERETVINTLEEFVKRLGAKTAQQLPIGLLRDREPSVLIWKQPRRGLYSSISNFSPTHILNNTKGK